MNAKSPPRHEDSPPGDLRQERLAHIVRRVMRDFQVGLEARLVQYDVNYGFWFYLRELWREEGLSQRQLSERVGLTEPTTHSVIKRMVSADLVELRPIVPGKPRQVVHLTPKGRDLRGKLEPLAEDLNAEAVRGLSAAQLTALRESLLVVHGNLQRLLEARD